MLKLSVTDLIQGDETCYSFVIAIAKRARAISEKANDEHVLLDEKPVKTAVREYTQGKFRIEEGGEPKTEEDADVFDRPDVRQHSCEAMQAPENTAESDKDSAESGAPEA